MENYHKKLNQRYTVKLRVLEKELPYFCTQFFNAKAQVLEKQSQFAYATDLKIFFTFLKIHLPELNDIPLNEITPDTLNSLTSHDIDAFMEYLDSYEYEGYSRQNSENGKARKLSSIKTLCRYLLRENMIKRNPAEQVDTPKQHTKDIVILSEKQKKQLLNTVEHRLGMSKAQEKLNSHCTKRDYAILMLFLGTGMRISELVGLNVQDIDFENNTAKVIRKGGNTQHVYFSPQVARAIKDYLYGSGTGSRSELIEDTNEPALFISLKKNRLTVRAIQKLVEKYSNIAFGKNSNIKLHPHTFRKTYGTELYLKRNDIKLVQDQLGHKNITTTSKHYVTSSEEHKKLAAIDVLE